MIGRFASANDLLCFMIIAQWHSRTNTFPDVYLNMFWLTHLSGVSFGIPQFGIKKSNRPTSTAYIRVVITNDAISAIKSDTTLYTYVYDISDHPQLRLATKSLRPSPWSVKRLPSTSTEILCRNLLRW